MADTSDLDPKPQGSVRRGASTLRYYFIAGLATLFPMIVTLYILAFVFEFADGLLGRFINRFLMNHYGYEIPGLGLVMTIVVIIVAGMLSSHFLGQWMFRQFELWFGRLPVITHVYQPVKQLARFLFEKDKREANFRGVVLAQYPRIGTFTIAFVTNETTTTITGKPLTLLTLLLPNPPSPFTGPLIFVPKEDVFPLNMTVEQAIKFIVSGGVVAPPLAPPGTKAP